MDSKEQAAAPVPCAAGCGFFGNPACENMCSKCFRDKQKSSTTTTTTATTSSSSLEVPHSAPIAMPVTRVSATNLSVSPVSASPALSLSPSDSSPSKPRCLTCKKKINTVLLETAECRCKGIYCDKHRPAEAHSCAFDYKDHGRKLIAENNQAVVAEKVRKI